MIDIKEAAMTRRTKTLTVLAVVAGLLAGCGVTLDSGTGQSAEPSAPPAANPTSAAPDGSTTAAGGTDSGTDRAACLVGTWVPTRTMSLVEGLSVKSVTYDSSGARAMDFTSASKTVVLELKGSWTITPGGDLMDFDSHFEVNGERVSNEDLAEDLDLDYITTDPWQGAYTCSQDTLDLGDGAVFTRQ